MNLYNKNMRINLDIFKNLNPYFSIVNILFSHHKKRNSFEFLFSFINLAFFQYILGSVYGSVDLAFAHI